MNKFSSLIIAILLLSNIAGAQALSNGEYFIKVNATQKYLAIEGASKDNSAKLVQWDFENSRHFKFILKHLGNNVYTLKAMHSGKFLSTFGAPQKGSIMIQYDWVNQDNQKWLITPAQTGYYIRCYQNDHRLALNDYYNAANRPTNGTHFVLDKNEQIPISFDFKKNEVEDEKSDRIQKKF